MTTHSSTLAWKIPWTEGPGKCNSCFLAELQCHIINKFSYFLPPLSSFLHDLRRQNLIHSQNENRTQEKLEKTREGFHSVAWLSTSLRQQLQNVVSCQNSPQNTGQQSSLLMPSPWSAPLGTVMRAQDLNRGGFTGLRHRLTEGHQSHWAVCALVHQPQAVGFGVGQPPWLDFG